MNLTDIGFVYVLENKKLGICKIGKSREPEKRLNTLAMIAGVVNPTTYITKEVPNYHLLEKIAHKYFKEKYTTGEWFSVTLTEIVSFLENEIENNTELAKPRFRKDWNAIAKHLFNKIEEHFEPEKDILMQQQDIQVNLRDAKMILDMQGDCLERMKMQADLRDANMILEATYEACLLYETDKQKAIEQANDLAYDRTGIRLLNDDDITSGYYQKLLALKA